MTYHQLVDSLKKTYEKADASMVKDHVAIQFNVTGEAQGAFYLEITEGKVKIEPYEYYDRDVLVTCSETDLLAILEGKLDFVEAFNEGKIQAEGNLVKALDLKGVIEKNAQAQGAKKKTVAQKAKSAVATAKAVKKVATAKKKS